MQEFIVLGIIPGTDYQTTFTFWVWAAGALAALPVAVRMWRRRHTAAGVVLGLYAVLLISRRRLSA